MPSYNSSAPTIVYRQATAPTAEAGAFWYDTSSSEIYFSEGTTWQKISTSAQESGYEAMISRLTLEVLKIAVDSSLSTPDYDNMFCDYMKDADGADNTIDTGNTTSLFSTSFKYANGYAGGLNNSPSTDYSTSGGEVTRSGMKITTTKECYLYQVTKDASYSATKCYLYDAAGTGLLATASFSSNVATFNYVKLSNATSYMILGDAEGASIARRYKTGASYPQASTDFNWISGVYANTNLDATTYDNWVSVTCGTTPANLILRTNAQALTFAPAWVYLYCKNATAGTGSVTFDISFDGGTSWDSTGNTLNTKIAVTDGSSKNMIIKINLNGTGAGNTAEIENYAALLWAS